MLPPAFANSTKLVPSAATTAHNAAAMDMNFFANTFVGMSAIGVTTTNCSTSNRAPVKRRLFADDMDDDDQENNISDNRSPERFVDLVVREIHLAERERGLRDWSFDFATETPSTSSSALYEWSPINAASVPNFYVRAYGSKTTTVGDGLAAAAAPNFSSSNFSKQQEQQQENPVDNRAEKASTMAAKITRTAARVDATPANNKRAKEINANASSISRQARLTDFYTRRKRPISQSVGCSPSNNRKRQSPPISALPQSSDEQSSSSTTIFRA